jgi:hypothetical protein
MSAVKRASRWPPSAANRRRDGVEPLSWCGFSATRCGANPDGHPLAREEAADVELAAKPTLRPITAIADELGLEADEVEQYGRHAAKIRLSALDRLSAEAEGKLVCVTAVTPTKAGEGRIIPPDLRLRARSAHRHRRWSSPRRTTKRPPVQCRAHSGRKFSSMANTSS